MTSPTSGVLTTADAAFAVRRFLEEYPLLRRMDVSLGESAKDIPRPQAISRRCGVQGCLSQPETTWAFYDQAEAGWSVKRWTYKCSLCGGNYVHFFVGFAPSEAVYVYTGPAARLTKEVAGHKKFTIYKVGQVPSWSIEPDAAVRKALEPADLELLKKGLVCISQSYGLGAVGYFRRVVENVVGQFLDLVEEAAKNEGDEAAMEAVVAARACHVADEKLKLIAAHIPSSLRPGGVNPFSRLFSDYSKGLHSLSDEECLAIATDMRDALEFVFGAVRDARPVLAGWTPASRLRRSSVGWAITTSRRLRPTSQRLAAVTLTQ